MATVSMKIHRGVAPTALTTVYTVPVDNQVIISKIVGSNTTAAVSKLTVKVGGVDLIPSQNVPANTSVVWDVGQVLNAGDIVAISSTVANSVVCHISGVLIEVYQ